MNANFKGARRGGWKVLGGNQPGNLRKEKTQFGGATQPGGSWLQGNGRPHRPSGRQDFGKAREQWSAAGGRSYPRREGRASAPGDYSPGSLEPILGRCRQRGPNRPPGGERKGTATTHTWMSTFTYMRGWDRMVSPEPRMT